MAPGVETAGMLKPPQAMVEAQKSYELLCFPKERHSPRSVKDRIYMEEQVFAFVRRWLGPPAAP